MNSMITLYSRAASRKLVLHPNPDRNGEEKGHISLYLAIEDTDELSHGWEVNTYIKFFVFDQIRDKYLCIQDAHGSVRRFHKLKTEWGFAHLLSHDTLKDPSNGYLVDDTCVFGVEVFVIKGTFKGECFSIINEPQCIYFTWWISKLSVSAGLKDEELLYSDQFVVGGHKWMLTLVKHMTSEVGEFRSTCLSLKLAGSDTLFSSRRMFAKFKLRIIKGDKGVSWFPDRSTSKNGTRHFLFKLGYCNCLILECKIDLISSTKDFLLG
ncbi:hypothetical protein F2P56_014105 [Juglans regia]|uniref:MATH domain-containing protein n=2 Tax=Juglans regia TaxID=51240 RepID=A0A833XC90_JUGRE|nr:uncharacterized protein LOC108995296 [Juglans regia]KAF5463987.1 hypothetical protein F2P56_014105 [Juglans regia]